MPTTINANAKPTEPMDYGCWWEKSSEDEEDCYEVDRITITKKETSKKKVEVIELLDDDTGPSVMMARASASAEEPEKNKHTDDSVDACKLGRFSKGRISNASLKTQTSKLSAQTSKVWEQLQHSKNELLDDDTGPSVMERASASTEEPETDDSVDACKLGRFSKGGFSNASLKTQISKGCYEVDHFRNEVDRITKKETSKKKVEVIELLDDDTGPSVMERASASAEEPEKNKPTDDSIDAYKLGRFSKDGFSNASLKTPSKLSAQTSKVSEQLEHSKKGSSQGKVGPIPPCPPKPVKKPKSPHQDWRVIGLRAPKCLADDDDDLEWFFYYYSNKITGETRWTPPPPEEDQLQCVGGADVPAVSPDGKAASNPGKMDSFVVPYPSDDAYARELLGEPEPHPEVDQTDTGPVDETAESAEPTPSGLTFTGLLPVMLYMKPKSDQPSFPKKAEEAGVNPTGLTRQQLTHAVRQHFLALHENDVQKYLASDCFKAERQGIDRKRAEMTTSKCKKEKR